MSVLRGLWRLYALARYQLRGMLPPRRRDFRDCGTGVFVHHHVKFANCREISLGADIYIGPHCRLFGHGGIRIGHGTVLGEGVTLIASNHQFEGPALSQTPFDDGVSKSGIEIQHGAWVGQNALILPGVRLAPHSVIAAGSVVSRDTEAYGIYAGVPARLVRFRQIPEDMDLEELPRWAASKPRRFTLY